MHPRLGDIIETAAKPIAKALNLSCLDEQGQLKAESKCGQRKQWLNDFGDSVYDAFWSSSETDKEGKQ